MKIEFQREKVLRVLTKLLLSGKNYYIFIDIKRSQVHYIKYVENKNMTVHNMRKDSHAIS